jgi:hypothetical protein
MPSLFQYDYVQVDSTVPTAREHYHARSRPSCRGRCLTGFLQGRVQATSRSQPRPDSFKMRDDLIQHVPATQLEDLQSEWMGWP